MTLKESLQKKKIFMDIFQQGVKYERLRIIKLIDKKSKGLKPKEFRSVRYVEEILEELKEELNEK